MKEARAWTRKRILRIALTVMLTGLVVLVAAFVQIRGTVHQHCIKMLGTQLRIYAEEFDGKYPAHTNGFGDAIVACFKHSGMTNQLEARLFTAPGDDGSLLMESLRTGTHLPEDRCSRAYVQGLKETSAPTICLMFDRYPTRGGDHFHTPWARWLREVCMADGSMQIVLEQNWPKFRADQIELLVATGIPRQTAEKLYAPYPRK